MKSSSPCDCCSNKSKCIVITIETCHKKTSEEPKKPPPPTPKGEEKPPEEVREETPVDPQTTSIEDLTPEEEQSAEELRQKDPSKHEVEPEEPREEEEQPEESKAESRVQIAEPEPEPSTQEVHRLFKLPLLIDRHHGKGCAMEISVLERHEDTCLYKKEDVEGRTIDDRVGSYDCIGRMVFRTCNSSETESEGSKIAIHGGSSGDKGGIKMINPTPAEPAKPKKNAEPPSSVPSHSRRMSNETEKGSIKGSLKSSVKDASFTSALEEVEEDDIAPVTEENVETLRLRHQMMPPHKKHYPGDGCKLRPPRDPVVNKVRLQDSRTMNEPRLKINVCCQTEDTALEKYSLETLGSNSEDKRRSSFLGSIFRKSMPGKPNALEYRR